MNPVIAKVPRAWRVQPVVAGGLELTDIRLIQKAAREALLIEAGRKVLGPELQKEVKKNGEENEEDKWQKKLTSILQKLIIDEHKTKMRIGGDREVFGPIVTDPDESLWLSSPPLNAMQVLSDTAFRIAIQLRYGIDDIAGLKKKCSFCGKALTLQHCLACGKANSGAAISRHNTIPRIMGTNIGS